MPLIIPPWLQVDPLGLARIKLAANAQRNQAAAAERQAQIQQQRIEAEQEMQAQQIAAQERAAARRAQVLRETRDKELAQQAFNNQIRREHQAQQAKQFSESLKLRQQQAEREAQAASIQMEGSRGLQKDLESGVSLEEAFPKHAPKLLYRHPERIGSAIKAVTPPGAPQPGWTPSGQEYMTDARGGVHFPPRTAAGAAGGPMVARAVLDEQGNPTGVQAIPGAGGGIHMLPRTELSPEGRVRALSARLATLKGLLEDAEPGEIPGLKKQRDSIMSELERLTAPPKSPGKVDESEAPAAPEDDEEMIPAAAGGADASEPSDASMMDDEEEQA